MAVCMVTVDSAVPAARHKKPLGRNVIRLMPSTYLHCALLYSLTACSGNARQFLHCDLDRASLNGKRPL